MNTHDNECRMLRNYFSNVQCQWKVYVHVNDWLEWRDYSDLPCLLGSPEFFALPNIAKPFNGLWIHMISLFGESHSRMCCKPSTLQTKKTVYT